MHQNSVSPSYFVKLSNALGCANVRYYFHGSPLLRELKQHFYGSVHCGDLLKTDLPPTTLKLNRTQSV